MEMLEEMSSIHASQDDEYRADGIEEGASKRRGGASGKDKSQSKASYIDKNALLRGEISNIDPERSQRRGKQEVEASEASLDLHELDREALYRKESQAVTNALAPPSKVSQKAS